MISPAQLATAAVVLLSTIGLATGCGGSSASGPSTAQTCSHLSAVLGDGPDGDADPIGHAQAQVIPLGRVHTSNGALQDAVDGLARAYAAYTAQNGSAKAKHAVAAATAKLSAICPGVAG